MRTESTCRHFLITGLPGAGKTTLIRKIADDLKDLQPAGFYTEEIREGGVRLGFCAISLDGRKQILSHVKIPSPHRVGRYGVDVCGFEQFLTRLQLLESQADIIVIDEIGKMECLSLRFRKLITELLNSSRPVVATIALKGGGLIQGIKDRTDCEIFEVKPINRDRLLSDIAARLRGRIANR